MDVNKVIRVITIILIAFGTYLLSYLVRYQNIPYTDQLFQVLLFVNMAVYLSYLIYFDVLLVERYSVVDISHRIFKAVLLSLLTLSTIGFLDWTYRMPRYIVLLNALFMLTGLIIFYYYTREQFNLRENTLVVGTSFTSLKALRKGYRIIGIIDDKRTAPIFNVPVLGKLADLRKVIKNYRITSIIIAQKSHEGIFSIINNSIDMNVKYKTIPDLYEYVVTNKDVSFGVMDINIQPYNLFSRISKRIMDLIIGLVGCILFIISFPLFYLIIKLDSKGPALLIQQRLTTYNRVFHLIKYRTMRVDAEKKTGPVISQGRKDPRVTKVGAVLRRYHLDEIPQFLNIMVGHMSVVGPRPERPELSRIMTKDITEWTKRLFVKPGLTGLAQVKNITGLQPKEKVKQDLYYIKNQSVILDIKIILRTLLLVMSGK
ncbi:sugar transferase [Candidatus Woesearchaeota archaeon]|nr:sugar transferase [Candidatus Woesearchaeota archaeon]